MPTDFVKMSETKEDELPLYEHTALQTPDSLRILRLRPADDKQENIDCEIVEISLYDDYENAESADGHGASRKNSNSSETHPHVEHAEGDDMTTSDSDSSDSESGHSKFQVKVVANETSPHQPLKEDETNNRSFEAVSWCWGREPTDQILRVHHKDTVSTFPISKNLKTALWALRKENEVRQLWIDAICINQKNIKERNQQVPRMDKIYGKSKNVCIWLGESTEDSKMAMNFIDDKVLHLWGFDELIENRNMAKHWASLIRLMKRPWFSRRWVVQEIALSPHGGTVYCGKEHTSWQNFADAVSLFVEVETATHRLSDVMKLDRSFGNIPEFFGDVSSLGAALLVDATSNLFRNDRKPNSRERKPLSSLEYLVSRLPAFEATEPRDTIYALLAISRDTLAKNIEFDLDLKRRSQEQHNAMKLAPSKGFVKQNYNVDYKLPVIDVYQEFIEFSIKQSNRTRALDIICRPWAPTVMKRHNEPGYLGAAHERSKTGKNEKEKDEEVPLPSWIPSLGGAAHEMEEHPIIGLRMQRQNADPLVGMPDGSEKRNYSAAGDTALPNIHRRFIKWRTIKAPNSLYSEYSMFVSGFILDEVSTLEPLASNGNIPYRWLKAGGWFDTEEYPPEDFWRTLVADRGHGGKNPPTYFPRACKESMRFKAKTMSKTGGNLDTRKMINEGRCTIVAEFLRRVQEAIWNRQLMTTKGGRLGLARDDVRPGFQICILYGCSVPVILERVEKSPAQMKAEQHDRYKQWKKDVALLVAWIKARYDMKMLRRKRQKDQAQKPPLEVPLPSPKESLEWLTRPRKGSWPLRPLEQPTEETQARIQEAILHLSPATDSTQESNHGDPDEGHSGGDTPQPKLFRTKTELEREKDRMEREKGAKEYNDHKAEEKKRIPQRYYYRLVGECYVHGMMNGEAIDLKGRKNLKFREMVFELR